MKRIAAVVSLVALSVPAWLSAEPLPGWRPSAGRDRILGFVTEVTTPGARTYVTPADRIAVFDDDGTLWPEKPQMQGMFALQRLRQLSASHPEWRGQMPYEGALKLGRKYFQEAGEGDMFQLLAVAHAGQTQEAFRAKVHDYFATARHPRFDKLYRQLAYGPMRELVSHLKANGFRVFITSAGSIDVARVLAEDMFGIPADDVIGSSVVTTLRDDDGQLAVRRLKTVHALNTGPMRPLTFDQHVGRRPILAVGNVGSGGDVELLRYSQQADRPNLQILLRHDDFEREYAYDEADNASGKAANTYNWLQVSMRHDWLRVFDGQ